MTLIATGHRAYQRPSSQPPVAWRIPTGPLRILSKRKSAGTLRWLSLGTRSGHRISYAPHFRFGPLTTVAAKWLLPLQLGSDVVGVVDACSRARATSQGACWRTEAGCTEQADRSRRARRSVAQSERCRPDRQRGRSCPKSAVRAVPARLLLLCLLLRSSWLTVEGDRHSGAAGVLIAGADGQPWPCRSAWLLAFHSGRGIGTGANCPSARMQASQVGPLLAREWAMHLAPPIAL